MTAHYADNRWRTWLERQTWGHELTFSADAEDAIARLRSYDPRAALLLIVSTRKRHRLQWR